MNDRPAVPWCGGYGISDYLYSSRHKSLICFFFSKKTNPDLKILFCKGHSYYKGSLTSAETKWEDLMLNNKPLCQFRYIFKPHFPQPNNATLFITCPGYKWWFWLEFKLLPRPIETVDLKHYSLLSFSTTICFSEYLKSYIFMNT